MLHEASFKAEICCSSWLKLLRSLNVELPTDWHAAYKQLRDKKEINLKEAADEDTVIKYLLNDDHGRKSDGEADADDE